MTEIRLLRVEEAEQFIKIKQESLLAAPQFLLEKSYEPSLEHLTKQISDPNSEIVSYVLVVDGEILGFCQATIQPGRPHHAYTRSLYVRRDHRVTGQRMGERILDSLISHLRDNRGIDVVNGGTADGNTTMEKILTNLGYEKVFRDHKYLKLGPDKFLGVSFWYKFDLYE